MKELADETSLRDTGTVVEVDHPARGKYLTVGNPIKLSDSPADVRRSPLLGEHTDEILREVLGYSEKEIAEIKPSGRSRRRRSRQGGSGVVVRTARPAAAGTRAALSLRRCHIAWMPASVGRAESGVAMRIVVHGQQAFGKAVLEALLKRGDNVVAVYVAPEKPGAKPIR